MAFQHILLYVELILMIIILSTANFTKNDTELHNNVLHSIPLIPLHYNVRITFYISENILFGECNITVKINHQAKMITVPNLEIFDIIEFNLIDNRNNKTINILNFSFNNKTHFYLNFTELLIDFLSPGTYTLKITYVRSIVDDEDFFQSFYINKEIILNNGIKIINARELFPCWNEPTFKSIFNISILHNKNYKFLSSMSIREQVENVYNMWTYFDESPLMSAQHLIIVITTFVCFCTENVEFWYKREMADQVRYANDVVKKIVYYLEKKNIKKIPKIDYFVIKDFQHSNVKPWGVILLKEEDIIYNNTIDYNVRKMEIANVITYETISYWYDDVSLWSKEGFITFFTAYTLNQAELYRMMDLFVVQTQQEALRFETLPADSHPLYTANISAVHSFRSSFHYIKSSIIWRMLYNLISDNVFWTGIRTYIMQYNQSNVVQINQLWNNIQIILNKKGDNHLTIAVMMNNWITEKNYFQLFVKRDYLYNMTSFLPIRSKRDEIPTSLTLVTYTTKSNNNNSFLMNWNKSFSVNKAFAKNDWIIVNLQQVGYYRVNYDLDNWRNLAHHLFFVNYNSIHVLNRAQIIDDAFYFLLQKYLSFNLFWNIISFLFHDTDYVAWYPMIKAVEYMTCILPVQNTNNIKIKLMEVFFNLLQNIGYYDKKTESDFTQYLREEAVKWLCVLGDPECKKIATNELEKDLDSSVQDKPLKWKEWIYCKGLMLANENTWLKVWNKWKDTSDNTLLEYLTCSTNVNLTLTYFLTIMEHHDRFQWRIPNNRVNIFLLFIAKHAKNQKVLEFIFDYFKFNIKKLVYRVAILIVIITHEYDVIQLKKINELVQTELFDKSFIQISKERLLNTVEKKITRRIKEYNRQVRMYESLNSNQQT